MIYSRTRSSSCHRLLIWSISQTLLGQQPKGLLSRHRGLEPRHVLIVCENRLRVLILDLLCELTSWKSEPKHPRSALFQCFTIRILQTMDRGSYHLLSLEPRAISGQSLGLLCCIFQPCFLLCPNCDHFQEIIFTDRP